jgi:hypothetical protein
MFHVWSVDAIPVRHSEWEFLRRVTYIKLSDIFAAARYEQDILIPAKLITRVKGSLCV